MRATTRTGFTLLSILAFALTGGCRREEQRPAAVPPTVAQAAAPAPVPFAVKGIDLGKAIGADKKVTAAATTFAPADTIYASVLTEGAAPSVTLTARWTYGDGQLVSESTQTIAPSGPAATEFHISKPDGWPTGRYQVQVTADGKPVGTRDFEVAG